MVIRRNVPNVQRDRGSGCENVKDKLSKGRNSLKLVQVTLPEQTNIWPEGPSPLVWAPTGTVSGVTVPGARSVLPRWSEVGARRRVRVSVLRGC